MKRFVFAGVLGLILASTPSQARAQAQSPSNVVRVYSGSNTIYGAPGFYGTSYGTASYGVPRLTSAYSSPFGPGYGNGYSTGRYGVGLWRPGFATGGYVYGAPGAYRTFPASTWPVPSGSGPMFGAYAPGFGPPPVGIW